MSGEVLSTRGCSTGSPTPASVALGREHPTCEGVCGAFGRHTSVDGRVRQHGHRPRNLCQQIDHFQHGLPARSAKGRS